MPLPSDGLANRVAQRVESALGQRKFALWFGGSHGFAFERDSATLRVDAPHQMAADWIARHYRQELNSALLAEAGSRATVRLEVAAAEPKSEPQNGVQNAVQNAVKDGFKANVRHESQGGLPQSPPALARPAAQTARPAAESGDVLGLRHRLETFVVGPSNAMAYAAAERLSESAATGDGALHAGDQTLFLHGGCGLGKTHLLQGICRRFAENNPGASVVYVTGEQFTNAYIEATRHNAWEAFRRKFRGADLLAIDDAHFIGANKKQTQQEFLHTIKAALARHTRIVLASDSAPRAIHAFSEQLVSLCVQGLVVEVRSPDAATRRAMLEQLGSRRGLSFQPAALDALAHAAGTQTGAQGASVREIEGILTRLHALAMMNRLGAGEPVGLGLVRQLEQTETAPRTVRPPKFEAILTACCAKLGASPDQVKGRSKHRLVTLARAASVSLAREMTAMSYPEIAMALCRESHSTVITAHQRLQKQLADTLLVPGLPADLTVAGLLEELRRDVRARA